MRLDVSESVWIRKGVSECDWMQMGELCAKGSIWMRMGVLDAKGSIWMRMDVNGSDRKQREYPDANKGSDANEGTHCDGCFDANTW